MLNYGNNAIADVFLGENPISAIYKGDELVWQKNLLPEGYVECEYLESDGGCWIETGVTPSLAMKFQTSVYFAFIRDEYFCSVRIDNGNTRYYLLNANSDSGFVCTKSSWRYNGTSAVKPSSDFLRFWHVIESEVTKTGTYITVDNVKNGIYDDTFDISKRTLPLFGAKLSDMTYATIFSPNGTRCSYAKFYDNGKIIRNFIPCLDDKGVPCMYDAVSKQPFYNRGSGEFLYKVKLPDQYQ